MRAIRTRVLLSDLPYTVDGTLLAEEAEARLRKAFPQAQTVTPLLVEQGAIKGTYRVYLRWWIK